MQPLKPLAMVGNINECKRKSQPNLSEHDDTDNDANEAVKLCPVCGLELGETFLSVGEKDFHLECFKCEVCGRLIDGIFFNDDNGNFICPDDFKVKSTEDHS